MGLSLSNRQLFTFGLVVLLIGAVIGSVSLTYPFGRDQAIYAYAGKLLLEGKMNYLHVFDLKPPGIHILFSLIQLIFGESMFSARIFDILWQSLTAFVIALISFRLQAGKFLSLLSSFFYLFLYYRLDYWHTLQTDGALNLFFAAAVLLLLGSYKIHSFAKIFLAGLLFAIALAIKYTIITFVPFLFIVFIADKKILLSLRLKNILVFSLGAAFTGLLIIAVYFYSGALSAFLDVQFVQTPLYTKIAYETEQAGYISSQILKLFFYSAYSPLIMLSFFALVYSVIYKTFDFRNFLIFAWILSSIISLIIQWKFYYYHFLVIIPPISMGAVYGLSQLKNLFKGKKIVYRIILLVFICGFSIFGFKPYIGNYDTLFSYLSGSEDLKSVYIKNGFTSDSVFMISKTLKAVDIVKQNSSINDGIFVWGFDPLIYYLSERKCISRFIYNFPLLWKGENSAFRKEFIDEISRQEPKLIVVAANDPLYFISGYNEDSKMLIQRFPEFNEFLNTKYEFKTNADDYEIYELKKW